MSEKEVRKCPKCDGEMEKGKGLAGYGFVRYAKKGDLRGDKILAFHCEKCGFIELYKEKKDQF
jgi:predicted nucleic-acid-binding Zn-ribbon protein